MSEAKHITGPIEVCTPGDYGDYEGRCIVLIGDERRIAVVLGTDEEATANAKLFAAASELLAVLRDADILYAHGIGSMLTHDKENSERNQAEARKLIDRIRAAIAKAEGRA